MITLKRNASDAGIELTRSQGLPQGYVHTHLGSSFNEVTTLNTTMRIQASGAAKHRRRLSVPYTPAGATPGTLKYMNAVVEFSVPVDAPRSAAGEFVYMVSSMVADASTVKLVVDRDLTTV